MNRPGLVKRVVLACVCWLALSSCASSAAETSTSNDTTPTSLADSGQPESTDAVQTGAGVGGSTDLGEADTVPDGAKSVVIERFATLGGWDGNGWVTYGSPDSFTGPVASGDAFTIVNLNGAGESVTATELGLVCDPIGSIGWLTEPEVPSNWVGENPIAVKAEWDLAPYGPPVASTPAPLYFDLVREFFAARSLDVGNIEIDQWFKLDLEGDGVDEVVFTARTSGLDLAGGPYEYPVVSAVFLNRVIDEQGHAFLLSNQIFTEADGATFDIYDPYILFYQIEAFADLNGDGKQEIVISGKGFDAVSTTVWEYVSDAVGPKMVLSGGCGA